MKIDRFITPTWLGHIDITDSVCKKYRAWVDFEKEIDPIGAKESTTQEGWQYISASTIKTPIG